MATKQDEMLAQQVAQARAAFMPQTKGAWQQGTEAITKAPTIGTKLHESFARAGNTAVAAYNDVFGKPAQMLGRFGQEIVSGSPTTPSVAAPALASKPAPNQPDMPQGWNRQMVSGGVKYTGPNGSSMEGKGTGGETFSMVAGPGQGSMSKEQWASLPNEERIARNVAGYEAATQGIRDLRNARREAEGSPMVGQRREGPVGDWSASVAAERAAQAEETKSRRLMMDLQQSGVKPKEAAAIAYGKQKGMDAGDQIQLAKLQQDQGQFAATDARERAKMGLDLKQWELGQKGEAEERAFNQEDKLANRRDKRAGEVEELFAKSPGVNAAPAELQPVLKEWTNKFLDSMSAPEAVSKVESALTASLAESQMTLKDLPSLSPEAQETIRKRLQGRLGD